jgi:hypothetical protein
VTRSAGGLLDITALMPRHRQQSRPRHRAQRQGRVPGRRARIGSGRGALARSPFAAVRRITARPDVLRMARGALLTPWSAVSVGIVLASALTLANPRAVLTFPPSTAARCQAADCAPLEGQSSGPLPTAGRGTKFRQTHAGQAGGLTTRSATPAPLARVQLRYAVLPRYRGHFTAVIVIIGQRPLGDWSLRFVVPGSQIKIVIGARWRPAGRSGGLVSAPSWSSRSAADRARIVIIGTGRPGRPRGCVFDGARCSFRDFSGGVSHFSRRPDWRRGADRARLR